MSLTYIEDIPAVADDLKFDFQLVAKALSGLLLRPNKRSMVLGIHGPWGSGKTTLMDALRQELKSSLGQDVAVYVDFNAWKFQDRQALWRALILHVLGEVRRCGGDESKVKELEQSLYRAFAVEETGPWQVNWRTLVVEVVGILLSLLKLDFVATALKSSTGWLSKLFDWGSDDKKDKDSAFINESRVEKIASMLERKTVDRQVLQVQSIEQFLEEFRKLIATFQNKRVFVFIDDLDRCLPESALEIFEAIKLFLDSPGCNYIVALDRQVIRKGLAIKYSKGGEAALGQIFIDPDEYMEKTISVSYDLPKLSALDTSNIIDQFQLPITLNKRHRDLIVKALGANPRRAKRFMNTLAIQFHLAEVAKEANLPVPDCLISDHDADAVNYFIKLLLISYRYSGVFSLALEDSTLFQRLQTISNTYETKKNESPNTARVERKETLLEENSLIANLQTEEGFWQLMAEKPNFTQNPGILAQLQNWFRYKPIETN